MFRRRNADDRLRRVEREFYASPTKANIQLLMQEMERIRDYSKLPDALERYVGLSCMGKIGRLVWRRLETDIKHPWRINDSLVFRTQEGLQEALLEARRMRADPTRGFSRLPHTRGLRGIKRKTIACIKKLMDVLEIPIRPLEPFAWPGGYHIIYMVHGGPELHENDHVEACNECATKEVDKGAAAVYGLSEEHYVTCEYCNLRIGGDYLDSCDACDEDKHNECEGEGCACCGGDDA